MKNDINRWVFEIPLTDIQEIRPQRMGRITAPVMPCICCGNLVRIDKPHYVVHLLESGNLVSSDEPFDNSQGFFVIGNSCRHKLPNNFYWKV